jgi:uncharacterized protein (TIGR03067 family)
MNVAEHPAADQLTAFGLGKLGESDSAVIEAHLADCATCRVALESQPADSLLALARAAREPGAEMHVKGFSTAEGAPTCAQATTAPTEVPEELTNHPRYRILGHLGAGGMGAVFKAEHLIMQRIVALKVINRSLVANPAMVDRFRREAQAAARLSHPNIVHAHDADQAGEAHFLVMEHVNGVSLSRLVADNGPLPIDRACDYIRQAALGLAHAHERGMVHRDIKPQNLMLTTDGQVKILDFGLARFALETAPPLSSACGIADATTMVASTGDTPPDSLTQVGTVMGTPDYIAPEQARDAHTADIRADIYSLGCTLYDLLAGRPPFPQGTALQKVIGHLERRAQPLRELRPDAPAELVQIVDTMMAKDPAQRYQTPAEVAEALAPWTRPVARPPARSRRRLRLAFAACGVIACIVGVSFVPPVQDFAQNVIATATNKGVIEIVADDMDLEISVVQARERVVITEKVYKGTRRTFLIPARDGDVDVLEIRRGGGGVRSTTPFQLRRGGRVVLTAEMLMASERVGWTPLFNGNDLTGWKTHPDQRGDWRVEQGVLVGHVTKPSHLFSERGDYENFHFRVEAKISAGGDSGQHFRCEYAFNDPDYKDRVRGYEANIAFLTEFKTGSLWGATWPPVGPKESLIVPDTWFTQEVIAIGNHIVIKVNGNTTADFVDQNHRYRRGHLALQAWALNTVVYFRKVEIKELPPTPVADPGWTALFAGNDLTGWDGDKAIWQLQDGQLIGTRPPGGIVYNTFLVSQRRYKDFELKFQVRLKDGVGNSGVQIRSETIPGDPPFRMRGPQADIADGYWGSLWGEHMPEPSGGMIKKAAIDLVDQILKPNDFNDYYVQCVGKHVTIKINGLTTVDEEFSQVPRDGLLGWQMHFGKLAPTEVMFRDVQIRDVSPDLDKLQGDWSVVVGDMGGKPLPPEQFKKLEIRFDGDAFELVRPGQNPERLKGTFKVDPGKKQIILQFKDALIGVPVSYRLEADRLRLTFEGLRLDAGVGDLVGPARLAAERVRSLNNLKQIALGMLNYHDANHALPPAALTNIQAGNGKPLLSWRVALLPFIEQNELYEEFKLDEPWDSGHNKKLIARMPAVYATPGGKDAKSGMTHYQVFVGPGTPFEPRTDRRGIAFNEITDGTSKTLLAVEAADAVIWTRPDDLPFDPKQTVPRLGIGEGAIHVAFCDGNVAILSREVTPEVLRALITRNGGEQVTAPLVQQELVPTTLRLRLECERRPDKGAITR